MFLAQILPDDKSGAVLYNSRFDSRYLLEQGNLATKYVTA